MTTTANVSLVLCTYKRVELAEETCRQVLELETLPTELIVVVQALSRHDAELFHRSLSDDCAAVGVSFRTLIMAQPNLPLARNIGILDAKEGLILFIDDDVILTSDIVHHHATALRSQGVGAVGGNITGEYPWPWQRLSDGAPVDRVIGCNMAFRREALVRAGGFDPAFAPASTGEETDVSDRLLRLGWNLTYSQAATLRHLKSPSGGERGRQHDADYWSSYVRNASVLWLRAHGWRGLFGLVRHPTWLLGTSRRATLRGLRAAWRGRVPEDYLVGATEVYASDVIFLD